MQTAFLIICCLSKFGTIHLLCTWTKKTPFGSFRAFFLRGQSERNVMRLANCVSFASFLQAACCQACDEKVQWTFSSNINFARLPAQKNQKDFMGVSFPLYIARGIVQTIDGRKIISRLHFQEIRHFSAKKTFVVRIWQESVS